MKKVSIIILLLLFLLACLFVTRFIVGGNEDTWICTNGEWVKHGNPINPAPQTGCGQKASPLPTNVNVESLDNKIIQILSQKYNRPQNELIVVTTINTGSYAKGTLNFPEGGGGLWFAARVNSEWQLVFDGNGIIPCSALINFSEFPTNIIPQCLDENTQSLVKR